MTKVSLSFFMAMAVTLLMGASASFAQSRDIGSKADALLRSAFPADGPGAAVIVTRGGRTVYIAGRGLADVEGRRPIMPDTVFSLGSNTKQFTSAVILQLVQEGRISLDDPVARFIPGYPEPGASATVRQLLNHTSGIPSFNEVPGWMVEANTDRAYTTAQMISLFSHLPQAAPPGSAWAYSNSGYVLLGAIIESVTGKPWHHAITERVTLRLRLSSLAYGAQGVPLRRLARGYTDSGGQVGPARRTHVSVQNAAAGLVGTVRDLARWARALHHGRVVGPALHSAMTTPTQLPGGRTLPYGFGLAMGEVRGRAMIRHDGRVAGFNTETLYVPSADVFVAVLANSDSPASPPAILALRLAALAIGDPYPEFRRSEVESRSAEPLFGVYRTGSNGASRRFFGRDGRFFVLREGGAPTEVFAAGGDRFFYGPQSLSWFSIERQAGGAHKMRFYQQGAPKAEEALRVAPPSAPAQPGLR